MLCSLLGGLVLATNHHQTTRVRLFGLNLRHVQVSWFVSHSLQVKVYWRFSNNSCFRNLVQLSSFTYSSLNRLQHTADVAICARTDVSSKQLIKEWVLH